MHNTTQIAYTMSGGTYTLTKGEHEMDSKKENIKVAGHVGTWYVISQTRKNGRTLYLLEHEQYGDEAACIIVDGKMNVVKEDVYNGFEDLEV